MIQTKNYATVLPKIGVQRSELLSEAKLKALAESRNLEECAGQLRDTAYQEQISKISPPLTSRKLERAFNENLIETYLLLLKYLPKRAKPFIELSLIRFEIENLKAVIKATFAKLTPEQKMAKIYFAVENYFGNREAMEEATKASTITEIVRAFRNTEYVTPLNMGMKSFEETGSTACIDIFLDRQYFEKVYDTFAKLPRREKPYADIYASTEVDSFILLTLLRGKILGYDPTWLRLVLPHNYFNLSKSKVEAILSAIDFEAAMKVVDKTEYASFFVRAETPEQTLSNAEKALKKTVLKHAYERRILEIFNIGMLMIYLTFKETEVHNLLTISLGIEATLAPDDIRNQLLIV